MCVSLIQYIKNENYKPFNKTKSNERTTTAPEGKTQASVPAHGTAHPLKRHARVKFKGIEPTDQAHIPASATALDLPIVVSKKTAKAIEAYLLLRESYEAFSEFLNMSYSYQHDAIFDKMMHKAQAYDDGILEYINESMWQGVVENTKGYIQI